MANVTENSWKANGRPLSTIARSFSAALDDAFFMKPELDNLSQSVAQKQQALSTQKSELEELEARLRATEARLKDQQQPRSSPSSSSSSPPVPGPVTDNRNNGSRLRSGLEGAFDPPDDTSAENSPNIQRVSGGRHSGRGRNARSPQSAATSEQPPRPSHSRDQSSKADLNVRSSHSYEDPAATRPENTPPIQARNGDQRYKGALMSEPEGARAANVDGTTSLRPRSRSKV